MKPTIVIGLTAVAVVLVSAACVGDDPAVSGQNGTDGGSADGSNSSADGSSGSSGSSGNPACKGDSIEACGASCTACTAPTGGTVACTGGACVKSCTAPLVVCGDACVDTTISAAHCGRCDHSCEAGQCNAGACQPFPVATGFTAVHAIDIAPTGLVISADKDLKLCDVPGGCNATTLKAVGNGFDRLGDAAVAGTDVYFETGEGDYSLVNRCPVAGCPAAGPDLIENVVNDSLGRIVAGPNHVVWSRSGYTGPYMQSCSLPACSAVQNIRPLPPDPASNPGREYTNPFVTISVGPTKVLYATSIYNDATTYLRSCALGAVCTTPTKVDTGNSFVGALTQHAGLHYGASGAAGGGNVIWSASDATPTTRTPLVADAAGITDVAVDASGIYWANGTTGKIQRCATLTGCAGGGELLASGQTGATRIRVDTRFVYWMTPTSVTKVAK